MRTLFVSSVCVAVVVAMRLSAQQPVANFKNVPQNVLVNDTFKFCVTFKNNAAPAGLGPFIDVLVPADPTNGNTGCDGFSFVSATVTSTNPNVPLTPIINGGCGWSGGPIIHPFGPTIPPVFVPAGMQLITLAMPFGSYQPPPQPDIMIDITAKVDANANVGALLPVMRVRGGFRFSGHLQPFFVPANPVTPQVLILHTIYAGADQETVAGHNFPKSFTVAGDVAPGQVLTGLAIQQCLPPGGIWSGTPTGAPGSWTWATFAPCFTGTATITGTGANTFTIVRPAYFDNTLLGGAPLCKTPATDTVTATGGTTPAHDPLDFPTLIQLSTTPPDHATIDVKALAIQKTPQSSSTPLPGHAVTYDATFQTNDYQAFSALVIKDTMSDGLQFASAALSVTDKNGSVTAVAITPTSITPVPSGTYHCPPASSSASTCQSLNPLTGPISLPLATQYTFDISAALAAGQSGILTGGDFGGVSPTPGIGTLTITANVLDSFLYGTHGGQDSKVGKDDPLLNRVDITGTTVQHIPHTCTDDGNSCLVVPTDVLKKEAIAVNGNPIAPSTLGGPNVTVGDKITFRETKTIDTADFEALTIQEFLPLPALQAAAPIAVGVCGPLTNCYLWTPALPPCPLNPATVPPNPDNSYTFNFGTCNNPGNYSRTLTIYTTHQVQSTPMPDGLLLTNEAQECEKNSYPTIFPVPVCQAAIAQFKVQEPYLTIEKGVCGGNCPPPASACPVCPNPTFDATTSVGPKMTYADAGDTVWFTLKLVNSGSGPHGAFDVQVTDTLVGFPGKIDYLNFTCIKRGDGTPVAWSWVTQSPTSFTISLTNATQPLLGTSGPTGSNVIIIVFPVVLNAAQFVTIGCYDNVGHIEHYANEPGGPDFVGAGIVGSDDRAAVCVKPHGLVKSWLSSSEPDPPAGSVTIGNIEKYNLHFIVPQGVNVFTVIDPLPGMQMVSASTVVTANGFTLPLGSWSVSGTPTTPHFDFSFKNFSSGGCQTIDIAFLAQVMNSNANHAPAIENNAFTIGTETSNTVSLNLVEPKLAIAKQVVSGSGGPVYTIKVTNSSNATAFDVIITDPLPACVVPAGTPQFSAPFGSGPGGAFPTYTLQKLLAGQSVLITFTAILKCKDCAQLTNTATVTWTSEPGSQGTASATIGSSCAVNGERCGSGGLVNTYKASASASVCGKVCGTKFADLDGDQIQDTGEPALAGWMIGAGGTHTTTDASGHYCIALLPGSYTVSEGTLSGWIPTNGSSALVPVVINMTTTHDFANKPECHVQICGRKTMPNGQGVNGWTITATPTSGPVVTAATATIAGVSGSYCMMLFSGTYTITEAPQAGWLQSVPPGGSYSVKVQCGNPPSVSGVSNANQVDFVNDNICANTRCMNGLHCVVGPSNQPQCVLNDQ